VSDYKALGDLERRAFVDQLNFFCHPSEEVSNPDQLMGRDRALNELRDSFETNGMNSFVWGLRGVGKTSLVHTACAKFSDTVRLAAAVACEKGSSSNDLLNDIFRRVVKDGKVDIKDKNLAGKLSLYGLTLSGSGGKLRERVEIDSVNHASDFLSTILTADFERRRDWVIVVDEFDQLENQDTIDFFTALAKQISVDKLPVKFVFCGVAANLNDLIGSHESVDRYLKAVELKPLLDGHIIDISKYVAFNMKVELHWGQLTRIAQIAAGYPHFAHVIMNEIIRAAYEQTPDAIDISAEVYRFGVQRAASGAATRLQNAYDAATKKGTDKYIEVLWSVADGQLLEKQFKSIRDDYARIMGARADRKALSNETHFRNHLNALCKPSHGSVLKRGKVGWYKFADPMLRSYVRMIAFSSDMDLGEESFEN
jgi:hypothetical protein